jgi:cytochrome c
VNGTVRSTRLALLLSICVLSGNCSDSADSPAAQGEAQRVDSGPDLQRGELLSFACQACHALTLEGGPNIGPSLHGVFGRRSASLADFEYSAALRGADFVWTAERLDAWLQAPIDFLPGTTMAFAGYASERDRQSLIAWLESATATASP